VDWIGLAQDRDKWRALVNVVMLQKSNSIIPQVLLSYVAGFLWVFYWVGLILQKAGDM
jgi:hypothetical protein